MLNSCDKNITGSPACYGRGFSIVELVLVIVIVSILAAGAGLLWPGSTMNLDAQARQLVSDIRYTQLLAMMRGERFRVEFSLNSYRITDRTGATVVANPKTGVAPVPLPPGMTLAPDNPFIVYGGKGEPYVDSNVPGTPLAVVSVLTLTHGSESRQVAIAPETGRVWVQ
ncbi:MAG: prepilin-type N-terminal cleavage/methylation domain-containing protein [Gammaproteobacteria bacterium]|nr:prepilin-type N-terminal cleavage/methylation domain-containing protein [Gammaproteobacteria bacterium]